MSHACAQWRGEIGACIVGALDGLGRARLTRHLAACVTCRAEYEELVPVRDWLRMLAHPADQPDSLPAVGAGSAAGAGDAPHAGDAACSGEVLVLAVPKARQRRARRRLSAAGAAVAGVAAAALVAAATIVALLIGQGAPGLTYRAIDHTTGVSGYAQLRVTPTGTQIDLTASGLPGNQRCVLVAVTRAATDIAGSWGPAYDGSIHMTGTTAFQPGQLTALRIESDAGTLLLSIRV